MSRPRHSFPFQVGSLRHVLPILERNMDQLGISKDIIDALTDLLASNAKMEQHLGITRAGIRLEQKHPEIAAVMKAFTEAEIVGFRYDDATPEAAE